MNKLSKDQLRDYIASEIKRINAWDDVPESQKAPRRVYVASVQKFADGHFDELMASRTHICVPEDFFHKLPHLRGSRWDMGARLLNSMDEEHAAGVVADRLAESLSHENDPQVMADRMQLNTIATILRANNGSSLAANLYSPITGLNIEAMKKLTSAEASDLINALKNEA